jgi:hypothetical protein
MILAHHCHYEIVGYNIPLHVFYITYHYRYEQI